MAAKEMPLILDNGVPMQLDGVGDVDDLFGDAAPLPLRQPSRQIDLRMDKLRSRGCCRTVAWSKVGTIASLTPDGQELQVRFLRCQAADGEWDLSEPVTCPLVRGTLEDPLVHLEWSETNNPELAVFDSTGRVTLLIFSNFLNHPHIMRKPDKDAVVDDSHAIVGCHWLAANVSTAASVGDKSTRQAYNVLYGPASRTERGYHYESSFVHAESPSHPQPGRTALLAVTSGGMLKMYWMQVDNRPEETKLELESLGDADELITHASFAAEKKYLDLALVTTSRQLKFLRIDLRWGAQPGKSASARTSTQFTAALAEKHLATTSWMDDSAEDLSMPEVSHLLTLPSLLDNTGKDMVPPMVISVRARISDNGSYPVTTQSIIDRWEAVEQQRHHVHSALEQLGNRRNSISSETSPTTYLRQLEPIVIDRCVVGLQSTQFGKIVVITFSDGSVQHRDRFTFDEIYTEREVGAIFNLRQVGWTFPDESRCQQVAYSPTYCSRVQLGDDGKMEWVRLYYPEGDIGNSMKEEQYAATIAGLTVTAATAIKYQSSFDDMLAIVRAFASKPRFAQDWVSELVRILMIQIDYVVEPSHDALLKNAHLPSCMAILMSLGFGGDTHPRTFQSSFAQLLTAIRSAAFNMTVAINAPFTVNGRKSLLDDHETVDVLAAIVKWCLGLLSWLTDSLFELMNDDEFLQRLAPDRANELAPYLEKRNDIALHLVLCSSSRCFLSALCRRVAHIEGLGPRAVEFYRKQSAMSDAKPPNPRLRQAYQNLQQASNSGIVKVNDFERLVNILGAGVNQAYDTFLPKMIRSQPKPPQGKEEDEAVKAARSKLEAQMLVATAPPVGFIPVLRKFFSQDLPAFRRTTDPARLFFENFSVINVQDDQGEVDGVRTSHLDAFCKAKLKMGPDQQWRRCTRCTAVMEECGRAGPALTFLITQLRRCPCGGAWAVLPPGKLEL